MTPKVSNLVKCNIYNVLQKNIFNKLNKSRKDFICCVLWHILSIKGKINFLQLGRFRSLSEQTFQNQFQKNFLFVILLFCPPESSEGTAMSVVASF